MSAAVSILACLLLIAGATIQYATGLSAPVVPRTCSLSVGSFMIGILVVHIRSDFRLLVGLRRCVDLILIFVITDLVNSLDLIGLAVALGVLFVVQVLRLLRPKGHGATSDRSLLI